MVDHEECMKSLQESEARFRILCESMPVGLLVLNKDGTILLSNQTAEAMFLVRSEEILGQHYGNILQAPQGLDVQEMMKLIKERGPLELEAKRSNGIAFPIELSLRDFDIGEENCVLASVLDVSEKRAAQRLKQELMAMVSHDMSSPLTSIQVTLNLLGENALGELNATGVDLVSRASLSAEQLIKLVNDL